MARQKTGDKLKDIRKATIAEVVEVGSSAASVNAIAKRAGLAVGTVYRYHENKDQLLRSVYLSIKSDLHGVLMEAASRSEGSAAKLRAMWFALLDFAGAEPQAFLFVEVMMNDTLLSRDDHARIAAMAEEMTGVIEAAIFDGTLRPGDARAISTVLVAPALQLGRKTALGGDLPDDQHAQNVFDLCWHGVAR